MVTAEPNSCHGRRTPNNLRRFASKGWWRMSRPKRAWTIWAASALLVVLGTWGSETLALPIDSFVNIRPIQICDNGGANCANPTQQLFAAETNKIWAQAGIQVNFLPFTSINNTAFQTLNVATELGLLTGSPGNGQLPDSIPIPIIPNGCSAASGGCVMNMWFANAILTPTAIFGVTAAAPGLTDAFGFVISDSVFSFNGGIGRRDTIAHEIGHMLLLDEFIAGPTTNLMHIAAAANGFTDRLIPSSVSDIFPDGALLDQLTDSQIATARAFDKFVQPLPDSGGGNGGPAGGQVPEPSTFLLLGSGMAGLFIRRRLNSRLV